MSMQVRLSVIACVLCVACTPVTSCPDDLRFRMQPSDVTIVVGQSATASAEFLGCGGTKVLDDVLTWSVVDSLIANVNPATGVITGRAPGITRVEVSGKTYGRGLNALVVTVR